MKRALIMMDTPRNGKFTFVIMLQQRRLHSLFDKPSRCTLGFGCLIRGHLISPIFVRT
jgi:hypothetical protein